MEEQLISLETAILAKEKGFLEWAEYAYFKHSFLGMTSNIEKILF